MISVFIYLSRNLIDTIHKETIINIVNESRLIYVDR